MEKVVYLRLQQLQLTNYNFFRWATTFHSDDLQLFELPLQHLSSWATTIFEIYYNFGFLLLQLLHQFNYKTTTKWSKTTTNLIQNYNKSNQKLQHLQLKLAAKSLLFAREMSYFQKKRLSLFVDEMLSKAFNKKYGWLNIIILLFILEMYSIVKPLPCFFLSLVFFKWNLKAFLNEYNLNLQENCLYLFNFTQFIKTRI